MTQTLDADTVTDFARAVRRQLLDLGPDTTDELTDGLEADLGDKLADGDALGDPAAYAAELRAAAGFGARTPRAVRVLDRISSAWHGLLARLAPIAALPVVAPVVAMLVAIRPVWWLVRGWALFYVFSGFNAIPNNPWDLLAFPAALVLSVQWGRGKWLPWRWSRGGVIALSVIALLAMPNLTTAVAERLTFPDEMDPWEYIGDGILLDKQYVTNIFAYGPDGELLSGVQLFDQNGRPLSVVSPKWPSPYLYTGESDDALVPSEGATGQAGWNVYPLQSVPVDDIDDERGTVPSWALRTDVRPPFTSVQPLRGYQTKVAD